MSSQVVALPANAWRLYQMLMLVSGVREAVRGKPSLDWLKPFMSERHFRKGDLLFAKGETADEMFYTMTGRYILVELGVEIPSGHLVGELAMVAPDNGAPRRWNALRAAQCYRSPTSRWRSSTTRIDIRLLFAQAGNGAAVRQFRPDGDRIGAAAGGIRRRHSLNSGFGLDGAFRDP